MQQFEVDIRSFRDGFSLRIGEVEASDCAVTKPPGQSAQRTILRLVFGIDRFELLKPDYDRTVMGLYNVKHF